MFQRRTFVIFAATPIARLLRLRLRPIERAATSLGSRVLGLFCVEGHLIYTYLNFECEFQRFLPVLLLFER